MKDTYYLDPRVAAAYDAGHADEAITTEDIPFYIGLAQQAAAAGQRVLELACGTGRVTLPIAEAGISITGLDASPAMLDVARKRSAGHDNPTWQQGDMASFDLEQRFGLVIIPFRSFLHLTSRTEQFGCLHAVNRHLVEGGRLALNFFNPEPFLHARGAAHGGEEGFVSRVSRKLRLRYVSRQTMEYLLADTGFEVEALHGWFDRRPFENESSEMVWLAAKVKHSTHRDA